MGRGQGKSLKDQEVQGKKAPVTLARRARQEKTEELQTKPLHKLTLANATGEVPDPNHPTGYKSVPSWDVHDENGRRIFDGSPTLGLAETPHATQVTGKRAAQAFIDGYNAFFKSPEKFKKDGDKIVASDKTARTLKHEDQRTHFALGAQKAMEQIEAEAPGQRERMAAAVEDTTQHEATDKKQYDAVARILGEKTMRAAQQRNIANSLVATKEHGLTPAEFAAVHAYFDVDSEHHQAINDAFIAAEAGDGGREDLQPLLSSFLAGMEKLPKIEGQASVGTVLSPEGIEALKKTGTMTVRRPMLAARSAQAPEATKDLPHQIRMYLANARDVSSITGKSDSVMVLPGTPLKSVKESTAKDGQETFYLVEGSGAQEQSATGVKKDTAGGEPKALQLGARRAREEKIEEPAPALADASMIMHKEIPGGPRGSNPAGVFVGKDGKKRFVKFYDKNPIQAYNEQVTNTIYKAAGIPAASTQLLEAHGKLAIASDWIEGDILLEADSRADTPADEARVKQASEQITKDFLFDFWLVNKDAAGLVRDNVLVSKSNPPVAIRIDNGGALLTRAKGRAKKEEELVANGKAELNDYVQGTGDGGRRGFGEVFAAVGIKSVDDPRFKEMIKEQIPRLRQLREATNNFETIVPPTPPGVSPEVRTKILEVLRNRADMIFNWPEDLDWDKIQKSPGEDGRGG